MVPGSVGRAPKLVVGGIAAAIILLVVLAVVLLSGGSSTDENAAAPVKTTPSAPPEKPVARSLTGSGHPNGDDGNTRDVDGPITAATISRLKPAWGLPLSSESQSQYGSYSSSPVIANGIIYSQDLASNVKAIDLKTGEVLWTASYNSQDQGPNGVVVARGRVFGATADSAFALEQKTGKELWSIKLVRNAGEGIDMAPGYHQGLVYVSTVPGNNTKFYGGGTKGILWALDAKTGQKRWSFDTAPTERWSKEHEDINLGGGLWHTPAFDGKGGMYFGVGNAGPFPGTDEYPWGSSRPGRNLYTNSLVKLDARTGKMRWYYQLTPHDLYDWDLQDPPILAKVAGKSAVIEAGKSGIVIAVDRATGKLLWKRPVGRHNGHDNDNLFALQRRYSKLKLGEEIYPGILGGVIAPMASDGTTVYVPVVNNSVTITSQTAPQPGQTNTGEVVAVDIDTGKIKWKREFPTPAFGATTVTNDVVFATTFDGLVHALSAKTGKTLWEQQLPASINTGVMINGDTVIAPAGLAAGQGQTPTIMAYRLGGK
ncbi:MAG: cytochrome c class [Frankiales bacterium]|nr:cytochrome c class [Frankiales bacterium]